MKTITLSTRQMIALIGIVVALVFVVTYVSTMTGTRPKSSGPRADYSTPVPQLVFVDTRMPLLDPDRPEVRREYELHKPAAWDFWFTNDSDTAVNLGLINQGCKCTSVEVAVPLPDEWKTLAADARGKKIQEEKLTWQKIEKDGKILAVPAKTAGAVRLSWKGEKAGPELMWAELHTTAKGRTGEPIRLEASVSFTDPVRVTPEDVSPDRLRGGEVWLGTLLAGESRQTSYLVWSSTRKEFGLRGEPAAHPCVTIDRITKLTPEDLKALSAKHNANMLCGYRVSVTVREQSEDGKNLDLGAFRRFVTLTSDPDVGQVQVPVSGIVKGDLVITAQGATDFERDHASLGQFAAGEGTTKVLTLSTTRSDMQLEVDDKDGYPSFMNKPELAEDAGDIVGKTWLLKVVVPPNRINGVVPRDTAIYLRTKDNPPRRIRIPVTGNAFNR